MGWQDYDTARAKKRLIVLCDGTWMNSDYGYVKPGLFNGKGGLQVPSNVTRISRCFKRRCGDGTLQIINYESGVGSGSNMLDSVTGGAFGVGLAEVSLALQAFRARSSSGDEPPLTADSASARRTPTYAPTTATATKSFSWAAPGAHLLPAPSPA